MMNNELQGLRALVGGSSQGIGLATAQKLAENGAEVILMARNPESLQKAIATLSTEAGQHHSYIEADFNHPEQVEKAIKAYLQKGITINILVNNTGGPPGGPIAKAEVSQFELAFKQHVLCNHILATALLDGMKKEGYGRIINIISTSVKQPLKGLGVSNTVRAAVGNWSKTLAGEVAANGITVNNVLPGATATGRLSSLLKAKADRVGKSEEDVSREMLAEIPIGRFAKPEEVAAAVLFLASPMASYITGINVPVDGGRTGCL